jgi:hypothetical protein
MKKNYCSQFILLLSSSIFLIHSYTAGQPQPTIQTPVLSHTPISTFTRGETIKLEASISVEVEWIRLFFRSAGLEEFQVRNMEKEGDNTFAYQLDTSQLTSLEFEYYLAAKLKDREVYFPANAPAEVIKVSGQSERPLPEVPSELPPPQEEEKKFKLPLSAQASIQAKLLEKEAVEDEKKVTASGNMRVFHSYQGNLNLNLDSNFSYTNTALEGERSIDLSNMMVSVSKENHTFRAGDINISESEYSVSGLGRRGMEYIFDDKKAYFHLFDVSSQQVKGFEGFGVPKSNISILGGAFGYTFLKDKLTLKAVYLAGKDDPNQGVNVGFSEYFQARKGNAFALMQESNLFQDRLKIKAEFGRTSYDGNLSDDTEAVSGTAFNIGGNFSQGAINLGTSYRYVGKDFNSIGFQSFTNDRESYDANMGIVYKKINLSASFTAEHDNVNNDPTGLTTNNKNGIVNLSLGLSDNVSLDLGYNRNKQKTFQGNVETSLQDSLTNEYKGGFTFALSPSANLSFSMTNSYLSSVSDPTNDMSTVTFNLTGSFRAGEVFSLNPTFGYTIADKKNVSGDSETVSSFLTGEVIIIPQFLSIFFSNSFNRMEIIALDVKQTIEFGGGLNLKLDRLIKIGSLTFILKGNYNHKKISGILESDYSLLLQMDFSF